MKTKIVIEDCCAESYSIQFTVQELDVLYRWFKRAPRIEREGFGLERYNTLLKKIGGISQVYRIEKELKRKKSQRELLTSKGIYL